MEKNPEDFRPQESSEKVAKEEELLEQQYQDVLAEVGNISLGAAATALSQLLGRVVQITTPRVALVSMKDVRESFPVPCVVVTVHYLKGLEGDNIFIVRKDDAAKIAGLMMGLESPENLEELGELELSALSEAMNQMMGSAATAMSDLFNRPIDISPPEVSYKDLKTETVDLDVIHDESIVIRVAFRMVVENLLDSELIQLIPLEYGRKTAASLLSALVAGMAEDSSALPSPEEPSTWEEEAFPEEVAVSATVGDEEEIFSNYRLDLIKDISIEIKAVLGKARLPLKRVFSLAPGEIIALENYLGEPVELYANDQLVARGEVVLVNGQFGLRITAMLNSRLNIKE